ncbi:BACON domain-containing protein [Sphingobacterium shayense]|uniref:BACON domain-containing protein n=1 Tax=Sphingobacterium shayense TaxID=626343 RepID=UPI0015580528|nr:BACON domain-containing carbohydrate-binding protein [Sphingobacterium shayense]NQD70943.1 BACON domain-containing protein [Sphingobacterium shayense]
MKDQMYFQTLPRMLRYLGILLAILFITSCSKSDMVHLSTLEVSELKPVIDASEGAVSIDILSNSSWKVGKLEAGWLTVDRTEGSGDGKLSLSYAENKGIESRTAEFFIVAEDGKSYQKIQLTQLSANPFIKLELEKLEVVSRPRSHKIDLSSNIPSSAIGVEILYEEEVDDAWIVGVSMEGDSLRFQTTINTLTEKRTAHIILSYDGALEEETDIWDKIIITQMDAGNDFPPQDKDFAYVRELPLGDIEENIAIRGHIVSTGSSDNFRKNTYIIQDANNTAVAFETLETLPVNKYDKVQLLLDGTKIETFQDAGESYRVIKGISAANILERQADPGFSPPSLSIKELREEHLLSLVTLKDVEFAVPHGGYSNFHEYYPTQSYAEYATRHYPAPIRDIQGDNLYLITNRAVEYRRKSVPKGSGNITGLVVKIKDSAYGDLGEYSIRHLSESDIQVNPNSGNGFSKILVEWEQQWNAGDFNDGVGNLAPTIGPKDAILNKDKSDGFYFNTKVGGIYLIDKYRGDKAGSGTSVSKSTYNVNGWGAGRYWLFDNVSTLGINTSLSLQIEGNSSTNSGPRDFAVEYSLDGENWSRVGTYQLSGQISAGESEFVIASGKMFSFKLPDVLLNQPNIKIRLINISAISVNGTQTTASATSRLSHFSIQYNK